MTGYWHARRRRDGERSAISQASRCFSHQERRTSSPAPRFPSTADFRSWAEVRKRGAWLRGLRAQKKPRQCRGRVVGIGNEKAPDDAEAFSSWKLAEDQYFATTGAAQLKL